MDMGRFRVAEATISQVHQAMEEGMLTCRELTEAYLQRIEAYDKKGPGINAIITVNPQALSEAEAMDEILQKTGKLAGPLHGIPVLLKDNINTCRMVTTAGSLSMAGFVPEKDAFITKRLKDAETQMSSPWRGGVFSIVKIENGKIYGSYEQNLSAIGAVGISLDFSQGVPLEHNRFTAEGFHTDVVGNDGLEYKVEEYPCKVECWFEVINGKRIIRTWDLSDLGVANIYYQEK